jgi:hypothetical protein
LLALPVSPRGAGRPQQAVIWPKNLWVDTYCQTATMTSMHVVGALQCLAAGDERRLGKATSDPIEEAGQREAAP